MDIDAIKKLFATDETLEKSGRWVRVGNAEFLLARAGGSNTKFTAAYAAAMRPFKRQQDMGTFSNEQALAVLVEPFVKYVLLDWRNAPGVKVDPGKKDTPYSVDGARSLMLAEHDLFSTLLEAAGNFSNYAPEDVEDDIKNL